MDVTQIIPPVSSIAEHFWIVIGVLAIMLAGLFTVLRGYKWLLTEVTAVVAGALESHEQKEAGWQEDVTRRLLEIEQKVDRIMEKRR